MKNGNTSPSMAAVVPTYLSASSSSASSPGDSGGPVFYTPPHYADSSARQKRQQQSPQQLIHWKSVHHETCVRQTTLTASLAQVVQDDHATIDILPLQSDVTLWNNDNDALSNLLLQRLEKAVAPKQKPSFLYASPTKKSATSASTAAAASATTESSTTSTTTSIFSSPSAKLLQRVVWTTASLVATPISYALASVTAAPTSDYDDPPPNVHYYDDDDFLYENSNDDDGVGSSSKKDMNETKKSSNQPTTATTASLEVGMKQPIVDVDLALNCLVFLHQAMSTSPERILTLPDENRKSSSSSSLALQQQPYDWQRWIRKVSDDPASEAVVAAAKICDDDIGAVLSDLPMDHTLFLLTILQKFQACQVIARQPKDVNLVVLPEMAGGGVLLHNNTKEGDHQASTALQTRITLFDLDCQLQRLERFMNEYNARIDHYTQQAARHKKLGRPKEAMNCLRHRKLLQHQVELYQNQSLNLESIQLAVTHSADTNTVFQTFQQAARALKEMRESSSTTSSTFIQNVDDVLDDLEEELEWQHQIRATTTSAQSASSLTGIYVDDDDLLNELAQLVEEEVDNVRPNATSTNTASTSGGGHAPSSTAATTTTGSLDSPSTTATTTPKPTSTDDIAEQFQQQLRVT